MTQALPVSWNQPLKSTGSFTGTTKRCCTCWSRACNKEASEGGGEPPAERVHTHNGDTQTGVAVTHRRPAQANPPNQTPQSRQQLKKRKDVVGSTEQRR